MRACARTAGETGEFAAMGGQEARRARATGCSHEVSRQEAPARAGGSGQEAGGGGSPIHAEPPRSEPPSMEDPRGAGDDPGPIRRVRWGVRRPPQGHADPRAPERRPLPRERVLNVYKDMS